MSTIRPSVRSLLFSPDIQVLGEHDVLDIVGWNSVFPDKCCEIVCRSLSISLFCQYLSAYALFPMDEISGRPRVATACGLYLFLLTLYSIVLWPMVERSGPSLLCFRCFVALCSLQLAALVLTIWSVIAILFSDDRFILSKGCSEPPCQKTGKDITHFLEVSYSLSLGVTLVTLALSVASTLLYGVRIHRCVNHSTTAAVEMYSHDVDLPVEDRRLVDSQFVA